MHPSPFTKPPVDTHSFLTMPFLHQLPLDTNACPLHPSQLLQPINFSLSRLHFLRSGDENDSGWRISCVGVRCILCRARRKRKSTVLTWLYYSAWTCKDLPTLVKPPICGTLSRWVSWVVFFFFFILWISRTMEVVLVHVAKSILYSCIRSLVSCGHCACLNTKATIALWYYTTHKCTHTQ